MARVMLHSNEISCNGCVNSIRLQLEEVKGVRSVKGDPNKKEVVVEFEPPATLDELRTAMEDAGYPVDAVK